MDQETFCNLDQDVWVAIRTTFNWYGPWPVRVFMADEDNRYGPLEITHVRIKLTDLNRNFAHRFTYRMQQEGDAWLTRRGGL